MPSKKFTRYPAVELLRFFDRERTSAEIGEVLGVAAGQVRRWRTRDIYWNAYDADRYATMLGLHPWMVWGDLWFAIERQEAL